MSLAPRRGALTAEDSVVLRSEIHASEQRRDDRPRHGLGLTIKPKPKSKSGFRTLELPRRAVQMLRARRQRVPVNEWSVVFTAAGYDWMISHIYRRTVATLMNAAGLTARQAAGQLGHPKVSMTLDDHVARMGAASASCQTAVFLGTPPSPRSARPARA